MLVERKTVKRTRIAVVKKVTRRRRTAQVGVAKRAPIVMDKADNSAVTLAIAKVGAKYAKMLNLLSQ